MSLSMASNSLKSPPSELTLTETVEAITSFRECLYSSYWESTSRSDFLSRIWGEYVAFDGVETTV